MVDTIKQLDELGWVTIIIIIALVIILIPQIKDSWDRFISALGYDTKKSIKEREKEQVIIDLQEKIELNKSQIDDYQNQITERQEQYHEQSIEIRNGLIENQQKLEGNQQELKADIQELTQMFLNFVETDNARTIATFRTSLWRLHKDFTEQGYVTPDGLKTFTEMGKVYTNAGGDDIFHDKLEPEVLALDIHYPDGSIYKKPI